MSWGLPCNTCAGKDCQDCNFLHDYFKLRGIAEDDDLCMHCPNDYRCTDCGYLEGYFEEATEEEWGVESTESTVVKNEFGVITYAGYGTNYAPSCKHGDWVDLPEGRRMFLKGKYGDIALGVDVYIDLCDQYYCKHVPGALQKYMPHEDFHLVKWGIGDGTAGPDSLVVFCLKMIRDGLTIGFGCVGGHGRTGWLAARIYKTLAGCSGDDAVAYIRSKYCDKAVETTEQTEDLGCATAKPRHFYGYGKAKKK